MFLRKYNNLINNSLKGFSPLFLYDNITVFVATIVFVMTFKKSEMLYDDGVYYKWRASADHDNPYYKKGLDWSELNRTEGYEVLYFINHVVEKWSWTGTPGIAEYKKIEKMIRYSVPTGIKTHKQVEDWIKANW